MQETQHDPLHVLLEVQEKWGEWIEMSENPQDFVSWVLAQRVIELQAEIQYLKKVLDASRK